MPTVADYLLGLRECWLFHSGGRRSSSRIMTSGTRVIPFALLADGHLTLLWSRPTGDFRYCGRSIISQLSVEHCPTQGNGAVISGNAPPICGRMDQSFATQTDPTRTITVFRVRAPAYLNFIF